MTRKLATRVVTMVLSLVMLLSLVPAAAFAAIPNWEDTNVVYDGTTFGTNGYYNVISKKDYVLVPGAAVESEIVLNNADGNRRQVLHIIEVDPSNPDVSIVPGYNQIDKVAEDPNNEANWSHIISIHRTTNQAELAQIYTAADLFVNPTQEDTFPTVNMESIACGTPVLTFRTGGSPECIDEKTGMVVDCDDEEALYQRILEIADRRPSSEADCIARAQHFDENKKLLEYAEIYEQLLRCDVSEKKEG